MGPIGRNGRDELLRVREYLREITDQEKKNPDERELVPTAESAMQVRAQRSRAIN
jgi:hypothetical protein